MEDVKNVVFRSSMRGYNKSDVNSYLVKFSADAAEREESAKAEARSATERAEKAEQELCELKEKTADIERSADEWRDRIKALEAERDELASKLAKEQEEVIRLEDEMQSLLSEKESSHTSSGEENELNELRQKAMLYEQNSSNIGETLISAQRLAQDIIDSANEEARVRDEKSKAETEARKRSLEESARAASDSVFTNLKLMSEEGKSEIAAVREYALNVTEKALEDILGRVHRGAAKLEDMEATMLGKIQGDVSKIDNTPRRRTSDRRPAEMAKPQKPQKR